VQCPEAGGKAVAFGKAAVVGRRQVAESVRRPIPAVRPARNTKRYGAAFARTPGA